MKIVGITSIFGRVRLRKSSWRDKMRINVIFQSPNLHKTCIKGFILWFWIVLQQNMLGIIKFEAMKAVDVIHIGPAPLPYIEANAYPLGRRLSGNYIYRIGHVIRSALITSTDIQLFWCSQRYCQEIVSVSFFYLFSSSCSRIALMTGMRSRPRERKAKSRPVVSTMAMFCSGDRFVHSHVL